MSEVSGPNVAEARNATVLGLNDVDKQKLEEARQLAMSMTSHPVAFGTIEYTEKAGQLLAELVKANEALAREAHTWWTAVAGATAEIEQWRRSAERCVTAWTVVRGGVWDPNGLMDEHMAALRKALGPNVELSGLQRPRRKDEDGTEVASR